MDKPSSYPPLKALQYLLARPAAPDNASGQPGPSRAGPFDTSTPRQQHQRGQTEPGGSQPSPTSLRSKSSRSAFSAASLPFSLTPRAKKSSSALSAAFGGSMGKRAGTPAQDYLAQLEQDRLRSPEKRLGERAAGQMEGRRRPDDGDEDDDFEHIGTDDGDEDGTDGYEGLENVRACCDGAHDLSSASFPVSPVNRRPTILC
jgi:hypothetical protein